MSPDRRPHRLDLPGQLEWSRRRRHADKDTIEFTIDDPDRFDDPASAVPDPDLPATAPRRHRPRTGAVVAGGLALVAAALVVGGVATGATPSRVFGTSPGGSHPSRPAAATHSGARRLTPSGTPRDHTGSSSSQPAAGVPAERDPAAAGPPAPGATPPSPGALATPGAPVASGAPQAAQPGEPGPPPGG